MGAPRTRPLHPASPAHCRSGLREERADHRERAAWGSRGGRARAAPSFPLPSALGPRGPRRSEKMALHFQVSAPGCGPGAPAVAGGAGGGGSQAATPSEHSPLPGDGELAAGCARPPESALVGVGCSDVRAGGSGSGGAARQPPHPARGRRPPGEPGLRGRGGGRAGRGPARPGARSLIGGASGQGAGCAGGVHLPGGSGAQRVFVPPASTEPPHWCTVAERSGASRQHQLPPLSF